MTTTSDCAELHCASKGSASFAADPVTVRVQVRPEARCARHDRRCASRSTLRTVLVGESGRSGSLRRGRHRVRDRGGCRSRGGGRLGYRSRYRTRRRSRHAGGRLGQKRVRQRRLRFSDGGRRGVDREDRRKFGHLSWEWRGFEGRLTRGGICFGERGGRLRSRLVGATELDVPHSTERHQCH